MASMMEFGKTSRRSILKTGAFAGALLAAGPLRAFVPLGNAKPFRVAFFSDTHVNINRNLTENRQMLDEIALLDPAFAINAGDITDNAWRSQIDLYQELVRPYKFKIHHCPGNHDVRWSPLGMKIFQEAFGAPYRAFEHEGCWFILLNSTVPLSHWGNLEASQMQWLKTRLERIGPSAPIFLFCHHWIGRESNDTARAIVQVDNEHALFALLRGYNVVFIGNGHGHSRIMWTQEGIPCVMNQGLYQFDYTILEIDPAAKVFRFRKRNRPDVPSVDITYPLERTKPRRWFESFGATPASQWRWNDGVWAKASAEPTPPPMAGRHDLQLRRDDQLEVAATTVRSENDRIRESWSVDLPSGVMSHVRWDGKEAFVSCMDGSVVCVDADSGKVVWTAKTGGYCHSSPLVTRKMVYVGSADGHLYAFDRATGASRWRVALPGPVYASPAIAGDVVFIANVGAFFGFDADSGKQRWRTPMPPSNTPFAQSVAATDGRVFVQGCWDSHVYALDARTGRQLWRQACQERTFAFSPAIGSPWIDRGSVYIVANGNGLFRFDLRTGEKMWEVASSGQKFGHSGPVVVGDRVIAGNLGDGEGEVRGMDTTTGKELWVAKTGLTIYDSCPRAGDGFVAIGNVQGVISCLRVRDGEVLAQYRLGRGHVLSTCAVRGKSILAASFAQRLVRLELTAD